MLNRGNQYVQHLLKFTVVSPIRFLLRHIVNKCATYYFLSFPKSGRTWVRVFLAKYWELKYGIKLDFASSSIRRLFSKAPLVVFTHMKSGKIDGDDGRYRKKKVIFLVRDPRDVVVSYYFQRIKRDIKYYDDIDRDISISNFIRHEEHGIRHIIEYMNSWYEEVTQAKDYLLLRYRDIKAEPEGEFGKLLLFLGERDVDPHHLSGAIRFSDFENMKKLEETDAFRNHILRPGDENDRESYKVRKGKVGGYLEYLEGDDLRYVNKMMKDLNAAFGYQD